MIEKNPEIVLISKSHVKLSGRGKSWWIVQPKKRIRCSINPKDIPNENNLYYIQIRLADWSKCWIDEYQLSAKIENLETFDLMRCPDSAFC